MDAVEGVTPPEVVAAAEPVQADPEQIDADSKPNADNLSGIKEKARRPETLNQTKVGEIDSVSKNAFYRKGDAVAREFSGLDKDQRKQACEQDKGKGALYSIYELQHAASGKQKMKFDGRKPVVVSRKDANGNKVEYTIVSIENANEENFICTAFKGGDPDSRDSDIKFSRSEVINAQIISEKEAILGQFEGATRDVMEMEIEALDGKDPMEGKDPSEVDTTIKNAARECGMLTADDVRALAAKEGEGGDALINAVKDKNIVDVDAAVAICGAVGYNPGSAENQRSVVTQNRLDVQEELKRKDLTPEARQKYQEQLNKLREREIVFRKVAEVFKENGPMKQFFEMMEEGRVDMATAKLMIANFRNGNFESLVETAFTNSDLELDKNLPPEEMERQRRERIDLLKKSSKLAGMGLMFLLFSLITSAIESGKR